MANNVDLSTAINNFRNAVYGKDVRDSLVEVGEAVQDAVNNQMVAIDATLTETGKGADAKVTGDAVNELKTSIKDYNSYDIIKAVCAFPSVTHNGITFTYDPDTHSYTVNGTATAMAFVNLLVSQTSLPDGVVAGKTYPVNYVTTDSYVQLAFVEYSGGTVVGTHNFSQSTVWKVPDNMDGIIIRLVVPNGRTITNCKVKEFGWLNTFSNQELAENIDEVAEEISSKEIETNLFDIDEDTLFGIVVSDATHLSTTPTLGMTGYIPVTAGKYYQTPTTNVYCIWYDSTKTYLSRTERPTTSGYLAPSGANYGRFIFAIADLSSFYIKEYGTEYPKVINGADVYNETQYQYKVGVAFGTSLTERGKPGFSGGYTRYLQAIGNMGIENQGNSSGTILADGTHPDILNTIKTYGNYADKDFVLIEGFTNDWYYNGASLGNYLDDTETTVCGCVRSALTHIMGNAPNATVIFILDNYGRNFDGVDGSSTAVRNGLTQYQFYETLSKVAESLSVPVIKLYAISGVNEYTPDYLLDNIHPTLKGAEQVANSIWSVMKDIPLKVT